MDIKSKNNKYTAKFILIISILIASIGICMSYPQIEKDSEKFKDNVFESTNGILSDLDEYNYALYYKLNKNNNEILRPSDMLLDLSKVSYDEDYKEYYREMLDNSVYEWCDKLNDLSNIDYYAVNKTDGSISQRNGLKIGELVSDNPNYEKIDNLKDTYRFYVVIDYDESGNINISKSYNANKAKLASRFENIREDDYNFNIETSQGMEVKTIKNMTYVYAVTQKLAYNDNISYSIYRNEVDSYSKASMLFINIALIFVIVVSLLVPYKDIKEIMLCEKISKLPLELTIIIIACAVAFIYNSSEIIMVSSIKGDLIKLTQLSLSKEVLSAITYILNVIYFGVCFSIISMGIFIIKGIKKGKMIPYIIENSIIVKCIKYGVKFIKKGYNELTNFDLKDKNKSKLIKLLIINLIILSLMCSAWFFGIIFAVIYTIVLFILIMKKYENISKNYNRLLEHTNEIASGNLDVNTQEDLGVFNSLQSEISNIQKGFKNAVDEEVKSQKMKTELISNVSHDLKTPLTSIITYVDLLKDENITEENREKYLDVLDRKSQRLKDLIEDLFEVSKVTSGNVNLNLIDVNIVSLMKQTLLELDDKIIQSNLQVKKNLPDEKVILRLDSQRMYRVFENLIINITKYAMKGTRVYIDVIDGEEFVSISFKNMASEEINYDVSEITDRFVRGDKSRNTEGSGLGLAIAKSFVELQGGIFDVSIDGDLFKVIIKFKK